MSEVDPFSYLLHGSKEDHLVHKFMSKLKCKDLTLPQRITLEYDAAKDPYLALLYARHVLKKRFPAAEKAIIKSSFAYQYVEYVIQGPWPEYEAYMMDGREPGDIMPLETLQDIHWYLAFVRSVSFSSYCSFVIRYGLKLEL